MPPWSREEGGAFSNKSRRGGQGGDKAIVWDELYMYAVAPWDAHWPNRGSAEVIRYASEVVTWLGGYFRYRNLGLMEETQRHVRQDLTQSKIEGGHWVEGGSASPALRSWTNRW